jgi:hypothetical protein
MGPLILRTAFALDFIISTRAEAPLTPTAAKIRLMATNFFTLFPVRVYSQNSGLFLFFPHSVTFGRIPDEVLQCSLSGGAGPSRTSAVARFLGIGVNY